MGSIEHYKSYFGLKFGMVMKHFSEIINRRMNLEKSDISFEQFPLLLVSKMFEGCSMQEIARITHRDKAGVLRGLRSLEKHGYIVFKSDKNDLRKRLVYSTKKSHDLTLKIMDEVQKIEKELFSGISESELDAFYKTLDKIGQKCSEMANVKPGTSWYDFNDGLICKYKG